MRVLPAGPHALLIEADRPAAWAAAINRERAAGRLIAADVVPGARTVLLDGVPDAVALARALESWPAPADPAGTASEAVRIPVRFDGADLAEVAVRWGTDPAGVVVELAATPLRVAFCGFAPGFAYLSGLPGTRAVPRLASPRPRVPAGAVGIAGSYVGIYPVAAPGGWQLVGHTDLPLFDVEADPPALLTPGRSVRLAVAV
ncbi:MAG: carboxyltransferase domain-containing protein [Micromonosporaceae bacterium]|nr:carboxyltransferase domain-containing protein [Micromonosporaceae bacterium]